MSAEKDAGMCGATHEAIDNGAPCKYLAGHLDAGIPHTTANGLWWADTPVVLDITGGPLSPNERTIHSQYQSDDPDADYYDGGSDA